MQEYSFTDTTILQMKDVSLAFDDKVIFKDINLEIKDIVRKDKTTGQVIGFLGPSGRGKTQLFKIIAGLRKPTTGEVLVHGKPTHPGNVGVVFQHYPLFQHLTVEQNLMVGLAKTKLTNAEKKDKVASFLQRFQMIDKLNYYPVSLSGGQRQRIAIIQQVLCSEGFLLLDEPFSGLDPNMTNEVCKLITEIADLTELSTVIVISHDIASTVAISNILWILGHAKDNEGNQLEGSRIHNVQNPIDLGISWQGTDVYNLPVFTDYVKYIRGIFSTL